jgi:hypothetical protein
VARLVDDHHRIRSGVEQLSKAPVLRLLAHSSRCRQWQLTRSQT